MKVSILVPVDDRPDTPEQEHALATWAQYLPDVEVVRGVNTDTPFNKSAATNAAAALATGDVFVLTDRDLIYPGIRTAVSRVEKGTAAWVMSDTTVRLGRVPSKIVRRGAPLGRRLLQGAGTDRYPAKGGVIVVTRAAFDAVGGMDERYSGWGDEDIAFMHALRTLVGKPERRGIQWHMYHPRLSMPGARGKAWNGQTSEHVERRTELTAEYRSASGDPEAMRALISHAAADELARVTDEAGLYEDGPDAIDATPSE